MLPDTEHVRAESKAQVLAGSGIKKSPAIGGAF